MSEPAKRYYKLTYTRGELVRAKAKGLFVNFAHKVINPIKRCWIAFKRWLRMRVKWPIARLYRRIKATMRR